MALLEAVAVVVATASVAVVAVAVAVAAAASGVVLATQQQTLLMLSPALHKES